MKIETVLRTLAAGGAFWLVMVACSAAEHVSGAGTGEGGGGVVGDVLEAATGLDSAQAAPGTIQVDVEPCSKTANVGGTVYAYAEHAYPGATISELADVAALVSMPAGSTLPGYGQIQGPALVKDGAVAVQCGTAPSSASATFVRK